MRATVESLTARVPAKDGDEMDAFSRSARKALIWRQGEVREIKARASRRNRRHARQVLRFER